MIAYNINGEVETITVTEVKIRANDGSIITVPPYHLLTANVINWRDIKKAKPRKISRIIHLDINSVQFCSESAIEQPKQSPFLSSTMKKQLSTVNLVNKVTNLEVFKLYVNNYLKKYLITHKQSPNFVVHETESSILGTISLEIIVPLNRIEWEQYEKMSSEIFFHLIAVLPEFQIKAAPK